MHIVHHNDDSGGCYILQCNNNTFHMSSLSLNSQPLDRQSNSRSRAHIIIMNFHSRFYLNLFINVMRFFLLFSLDFSFFFSFCFLCHSSSFHSFPAFIMFYALLCYSQSCLSSVEVFA